MDAKCVAKEFSLKMRNEVPLSHIENRLNRRGWENGSNFNSKFALGRCPELAGDLLISTWGHH